jgi:isopenicillin-N epimerase
MKTPAAPASSSRFGHHLRDHWLLEKDIFFFNHGSFGATPRPVLEAQSAWRERMERQPVRFLNKELPGLLRAAAKELAEFLGASGNDLVFVENATTGVNTVLRSIQWKPEDELVLGNHAYPAVKNAADFIRRQTGIRIREANVPFPLSGEEEIVSAFAAALTPATRLVVVDHVCSALAVVFPVARVASLCHERGIAVLVDGAHAPGMLPISLEALGADWYVGNCHKWLWAPKGCAFLWAAPPAQEAIHPLVISHGWLQGYTAEFDWCGTRDPSGWLAISAALDFHRSLDPPRLRTYLHELATEAAADLARGWGAALPAPASLFGAMVTIPLPMTGPPASESGGAVHDLLWERFRIEAPIYNFHNRLWIRIAGQVYNEPKDYRILAAAVPAALSDLGLAAT